MELLFEYSSVYNRLSLRDILVYLLKKVRPVLFKNGDSGFESIFDNRTF